MRRSIKTALAMTAALAFTSAVQAQTTPTASTKLTSYPGAWDTSHAGTPLPSWAVKGKAFDDEFKFLSVNADGTLGSNWYAPIHSNLGYGRLALPTDRQAIHLGQGGLHLTTRDPDTTGDTDANIQSMDSKGHGFAIRNGYVEAMITLSKAHGSHDGFWLLTMPNAAGHGEIDVVETYGAQDQGIHEGMHDWQNGASVVSLPTHYFKPGDTYTKPHKFGVLLTPTQIILYYDLKETARTARAAYQQAPYYVLLSNFTDKNRTDGYQPSDMTVQYVRAWGK